MESLFAVMGGVIGALVVFALMLLGGQRLVRLLGLPQDLPEDARYSPPAPPLRSALDPVEARHVAGLQARRLGLYTRAHALYRDGDKNKIKIADSCIDAVTLDDDSLSRAEAVMATLEQADATTASQRLTNPAITGKPAGQPAPNEPSA